ncbi:MAG: hypothetical protein PQ975_09465 [Methanobacterium sp.]|jgi:hypothetical protein
MNELEIRHIYGERTFKRGKDYFYEGRVLEAMEFDSRLVGEVMGTESYITTVDMNDLTSVCTCPVVHNCKHGVALLFEYLKGTYFDGDEIMHFLEIMGKEELLEILKGMIKHDPLILLTIQPPPARNRGKVENSAQMQIKAMLSNASMYYMDEDFADKFARIIMANKMFLDKEFIFELLEFFVRKCEDFGFFYNDHADYYYGDEIFENLCDAFADSSPDDSDFERLHDLKEEDDYEILEPFFIRMSSTENAPKLCKFSSYIGKFLNGKHYIEFLINCGKNSKAKILLEKDVLSEKERFRLYMKIDEKEAVEFAEENQFYSSLIEYYHRKQAYENVILVFRKVPEGAELEDSYTYELIFDSIKNTPEDDKKWLLTKLFDVSYSSGYYDLCVDIGAELDDFELMEKLLKSELKIESRIFLLNYLSDYMPEKIKNKAKELAEDLINQKRNQTYKSAVECVILLRNLTDKEEQLAYIKELYKKHYRKRNLWNEFKNRGIIAKKKYDKISVMFEEDI